MIRLITPLLRNGRIIPTGRELQLDAEFEEKLIQNGHAEAVEPEPEPEPEPVPERRHKK